MPICRKCGSKFERTATRLWRQCATCLNASNYRNRKARADEAAKMKVRRLLRGAVAMGKVTRQPCEVCAAPKTEAHHDDYSRPLDVRWLCAAHHRALHRARDEGSPRAPRRKYPLEEMNIGDSFYVEGATSSKLSQAALMHVKRRNNGKKFAARTEIGGARIERIA